MRDELVPADTEYLPLGSVIPWPRNEVPEGWLAFDGQSFLAENHSELYALLETMDPRAGDIFDGWGGEIDPKTHSVTLPDIDSDSVMGLMWGVAIQNGPELVLAIKAVPNEV